MSEPNGAPIAYPGVVIDGTRYELKFSRRVFYRLESYGIPLFKLREIALSGKMPFKLTYDVLAAYIVGAKFDPEDLADRVEPEVAMAAVTEALGKALPPADVLLREPAAQNPQPN